MKKIILLIVVSVSLLFIINQSIADVSIGDWDYDYKKTTVENVVLYEGDVIHQYTCKGIFVNNKTNGYATCYNESYNSTGEHPVLHKSNYIYAYNKNKTIYWRSRGMLERIEYINTTTEMKSGYIKNDKLLRFDDCNIVCNNNGDIVTCDSTLDGNGDGILQSGESGFTFNIKDDKWYNFKIKSDSLWYKKLKGCITKDDKVI